MAEKYIHKLYNDKIKIAFYPNSHRYKKEGDKGYLTSVTAIIGIIDKSAGLMPWAVRLACDYLRAKVQNNEPITMEDIAEAQKQHTIKKEEAGDIGTMVHAFAEAFALAKITGSAMPEMSDDLDERIVQGIYAFLDWYTENHVKFLQTEKMVYSKKHDYVGLVDAIAEVNGKKMLIDYKTCKSIYSGPFYQVAGYRMAYEEENEPLDGALILHFNKETGAFQSHEVTKYEDDKKTFLACLAVKEAEKAFVKPEQVEAKIEVE